VKAKALIETRVPGLPPGYIPTWDAPYGVWLDVVWDTGNVGKALRWRYGLALHASQAHIYWTAKFPERDGYVSMVQPDGYHPVNSAKLALSDKPNP
jgi:hypothetical protein